MIDPKDVRETLRRHMLVDGFPLVVDLDGSRGSRFKDAATGRTYLDFYTFFASSPIGFNHPRLHEPDFEARLLRAARIKPANSDVQSVGLAEFVDTFARVAMPPELPWLFLVEGGALAVENAMKAAFDWKARKNLARGVADAPGKVLHFREAFHGRSGYTMSVTNTDPVKILHFPKFDWPRVANPKLRFPVTDEVERETEEAERRAVAQIEAAFDSDPHGIAAILIEPIQCEGGDNHFRPEFFRELRRIADEREALLILDEVQTGLGTTGRMWAYEHTGIVPDVVAFAKKVQVGGILCSRRIEEVENHVFALSSRINSTWGGGLADLVRSTQILRVIEEEDLVANAARVGERLLAGLSEMAARHPDVVTSPRGRGLIAAIDLPDPDARAAFRKECLANGLIVLACGSRGIRCRPALNVTAAEIEEGLEIMERSLATVFSTAS